MKVCRAILLVTIALSLATFPLARGVAHALPQQAAAAVDKDCCHQGEPCEKKADDCGSSAACVLKCSSLPGALAAPVALRHLQAALAEPGLLEVNFPTTAENPPLPPPRL